MFHQFGDGFYNYQVFNQVVASSVIMYQYFCKAYWFTWANKKS